MAEDTQSAEPQAAKAPPPSMFTRKGLVVLIVLMAIEGIVIWGGFEYTQKNVNKNKESNESGIGLPQLEVGLIDMTLPPRDNETSPKSLIFSVWLRCNFKSTSKEYAELQKRMNDGVKRGLRDDIQDLALNLWQNSVEFQFTEKGAKARFKVLIKDKMNEKLHDLLRVDPEVVVTEDPVHSVIFEEWNP